MADIDVVIVNYKSTAHTFNCLQSLHRVAQTDGLTVQAFVINNGDDPDALDDAVTRAGGAVVVHNPTNLGFGAACNRGAAAGTAPVILFLNPDAILQPGALRLCRGVLNDPVHRDVGIVGPQLTDAAGGLLLSCSRLPTAVDLITRTAGLHMLVGQATGYPYLSRADHGHSGPVGQVMGAALMIRRPLFADLGGFDEAFFLYYEDVDLSARAAARGQKSYYLREAQAIHIGGGSSSQESGMALALHINSRLTYARRHFGRLWRLALLTVCIFVEAPLRLLRAMRTPGGSRGVRQAYRLLLLRALTGASIPALNARGQ